MVVRQFWWKIKRRTNCEKKFENRRIEEKEAVKWKRRKQLKAKQHIKLLDQDFTSKRKKKNSRDSDQKINWNKKKRNEKSLKKNYSRQLITHFNKQEKKGIF